MGGVGCGANKGARSAGVDGETAYDVQTVRGEEQFLAELRASLKDGSFRPLPVRERMIPKPGSSQQRRLGIATVRDRVGQAALKLVLEPIWETRWKKLYRLRGAVERENGRLKNEWALLPLRVRRIERVRLHADLTILARLATALVKARTGPPAG